MTKRDIERILEVASVKGFLDRIEYLAENDKEYKKSDFYKSTRINLMVLYEKYYYFINSQATVLEQITEVVQNFDMGIVFVKVEEFLQWIVDNDKVNEFVNKIYDKFDPSVLEGFKDQLSEMGDKLKK